MHILVLQSSSPQQHVPLLLALNQSSACSGDLADIFIILVVFWLEKRDEREVVYNTQFMHNCRNNYCPPKKYQNLRKNKLK